jgi:AcrR family transcriptional regulator
MTARPERVPAEEVKKRMLDAGRELALDAGAALTIEHLRLEEVIQRARVPRSSVYRLWAYREEYIDDLLCYLAGEGSWFSERPVLAPETSSVVERILTDNTQLLGTPEGRRAILLEVVRLTTMCNYDALTESTTWRLHMALVATLGSTRSGEARRRIAAALEEAQKQSRDSMVALLSYLMGVLGLRLRDPAYTLDHIQLAGGLLIQSLALRNVQVQAALGEDAAGDGQAAPSVPQEAKEVRALLNAPVPGPGLDGEPAEWTLAARAYLGVLDTFIELDPDFVPPSGDTAAG